MSTSAAHESSVSTSTAASESGVWFILKSIVEIAVLFGFFSTVLGWSYLGAYYSHFGLRPMELEVSSSVVALFAVSIVLRSFGIWLLAAVIVSTVALFHIKIDRLGGVGVLISLCLITLGLFELGSYRGGASARRDMWSTSSRLPSVGMYIQSNGLGYPSCVSSTPTTDCRILLHNKGIYYLVKPFKTLGDSDSSSQPIKNLEIYAIPESQVKFVQYERGIQ